VQLGFDSFDPFFPEKVFKKETGYQNQPKTKTLFTGNKLDEKIRLF